MGARQTVRLRSNPMKTLLSRTRVASLLAIASVVLTSLAFALDPPPGGSYPNRNTAEGEDALFSLTTGADKTQK
jgi:hypothetical protein